MSTCMSEANSKIQKLNFETTMQAFYRELTASYIPEIARIRGVQDSITRQIDSFAESNQKGRGQGCKKRVKY